MSTYPGEMNPSSLKIGSTAAENELYDAVNENNLEKVKAIISSNSGMSLDFIFPSASELNTPLLNALSFEFMDIAHYLLDNRASPWVTNRYNLSGLHMLAMVGREITPKKEKQVLVFLKKLMSSKKEFMNEVNRAAPEEDPRTPLTLSIQYHPPKLMKEFLDILIKSGAKYEGRGPMWAALLNSPDPQDKVKYLVEKFPKEFTMEKLKEGAGEFDGKNALLASITEGNFELTKFFYEQDPKMWAEVLNTKEGVLHKVLDNLSKGNLKQRVEIICYLIEKGADPNIAHPGLKKTIKERLKELPSKSWASGEIIEFSKLMLEKLEASQRRESRGLRS